jgi:hypothetical protein
VHARIIQDGVTIRHATRESTLPTTATSAPLRRITRPGARLMRSLPFTAAQPIDALTRRIAEGQVTAAPPKQRPNGVTTLDDIARTVETVSVPGWARTILSALPSAPTVVLVVAFLLALILWAVLGLAGFVIGAAIVAGGAVLRARLSEYTRRVGAAQSLSEREQTPSSIDSIPPAPDFRLDPAAPAVARPGGGDSPDAVRLKSALRQVATSTQVGATLATEPVRTAIDVRAQAIGTLERLNPSTTIPLRTWNVVQLPGRIRDGFKGPLSEVMYYPEIDVAMYRPLADISSELFLPNLNRIPPNSITLLETNQRFIEAYMVGLNHEFSRELLWRQYPTDARGSYFRQFWEVATYVDTQGRTPQQLREDLRDIPPIHTWSKTSTLGQHDNREAERGSAEEEVVLVIRGELLKRYPNAVIYAHRAEWPRIGDVPNGHIDRTKQRDLIDVTDAEASHPPASKVRFPLYEAKVDPDVYFFGFDLTAEAVKGGSGDQDTDDPGWFFVIKERPGEPRFGLDDGPASAPGDDKPQVWNELTWGDALVAPGGLMRVAALPTLTLKPVPSSSSDEDKKAQRNEDLAVSFSASTNAADLAYLLFQSPVLVAVHGAEMLRER